MRREKKRSYFITGALSMIPIVMTLYIMKILFDMAMGIVKSFIPLDFIISEVMQISFKVPEKLMTEIVITVLIYGLTLILLYIFIMITGIIVKHIINVEKAKYLEKIFLKIPFTKPIYGTIKQIIEMVTTNSGETYKSVVMVEYPKTGVYSIGFLTNSNIGKLQNRFEEKEMINVFIPTAPNPTTGFLIIVEKKSVIELDIKVDEALKMIVSAGVIVPKAEIDQADRSIKDKD